MSADHEGGVRTDRREGRLDDLRREALGRGAVTGAGVRPDGAPFPIASPETGYYGVPLLKEPQWTWEVPVYFFVGGAAGAAAVIGGAARALDGDERLARDARWIAAAGGAVSPLLLISDLGRPERFLNMLRVFKPQSPMSVGSWTLAAFGSASGAAAFAGLLRERMPRLPVRLVADAAEAASAALGLVMTSYTGVLIGATAIPVWNRHAGTLPGHFAASGLGAAVGALELTGHDRSRALNALGLAAAAAESLVGWRLEREEGEVHAPLREGTSGWVTRAGGVLSGPVPLMLRLAAVAAGERRSPGLRRAAACAALGGSLLTRIGWILAGRASARNPRLPLELE